MWFAEAARVGLGDELEMAVIKKALRGLERLPDEVYLSLNTSPESILSGAVEKSLYGAPLERIVLELTEHQHIADYSRLRTLLRPLRKKGLRLAVDDIGAGYASFRHILQCHPDIIKLDMSLTQRLETDQMKRALAAALVKFAEEMNMKVVAEGVETTGELRELIDLNVAKVQGYLISRPLPIDEAAALTKSIDVNLGSIN